MNTADIQVIHGKEIAEQYAVFVDRVFEHSRNAPLCQQTLVARGFRRRLARMNLGDAGENTENRVRISDINDKEHGFT